MCKLYEYALETDKEFRPVLVPIRELTSYKLSDPECVRDFFVENFSLEKKSEEYLYCVATTTPDEPIGVFECSHGTESVCIAQPGPILKRLLLCGATKFFIVHNHPSGNIFPGNTDKANAKAMSMAAKLVGLKFTDSMIIGWNRKFNTVDYFSMREKGILDDGGNA